MSHMLKKLPFLKDSQEAHPQMTNNDLQRWDNQEAQFSGSHPSTSSAAQRAMQVLPLLVKSSPAPMEFRRKSQLPVLGLPDLAQRGTVKPPLRAAQMEMKHGQKEPPPLPRGPEREKRGSLDQGRKRSQDAILSLYPELSDEHFRYLWESKRSLKGKSVKEILDSMEDTEILDTILEHLHPPQIPADHKVPRGKINELQPINQKISMQQSASHFVSKDKLNLYKYYGLKLKNTKQKDLVKDHLQKLLAITLADETDREGVSETIHLAAFHHLPEVLLVLKEVGNIMQPKRPSLSEGSHEDTQYLSDRRIRTTLILCYGQAAQGASPEDLGVYIQPIVSEILVQYSTMNKDEGLKKAFMKSIIMVTKAAALSRRQDLHLPQKQELVTKIIEVIEDEPARPLSVVILHQAIVTIICMSRMKPSLPSEVRSEVVNQSIRKVFSLPAIKVSTVKTDSQPPSSHSQDFYHQTATACNNMLTGLLSEAPNLDALQEILTHTNPWINSPKSHERERALKTIKHLLKFVSDNVNFDTTADFSLLGQLVALLALHIGDTSPVVGQTSAEAAYHLHHLLMSKMAKEMDKKQKNKKGNIVHWLREDFFVSGSGIFHNNISKMAKAFGEHLSPLQLTKLILEALENLTHVDKNISQSAGLLLNSILEECGMDIEELPMILKEIYHRLPNIAHTATKDLTLKTVCHLASKRVNRVVDILLESSVGCDGSAKEIWGALAADPYANLKIMKPLLKRLQDQDPGTEVLSRRNSKSLMPIAATNALCFLLSLPNAAELLHNKFSNLLLALVTQLYFLLGASKSGARRSSRVIDLSEQVNLLGTAVQAIKNLILAARYEEEYKELGTLGCWEMLLSPDSLFEAIFHLVRKLFNYSKVELKVMFRQANIYLHRPDLREKTIGMVFFSELLYHQEVGHFFVMKDILNVLQDWMAQPYPLIQIFAIRGLGYLLQHPFENKMLEPVIVPVVNCACHPDKFVAKESLRTLQFLFRYLNAQTYGWKAVNLIPVLGKYFAEEDIELRNTSIILFGLILKGLKETEGNLTESILHSLIPLVIQLANNRTQESNVVASYGPSGEGKEILDNPQVISRNTLTSCVSFMKWEEVPDNLFDYEIYTSLQSMYSSICSEVIVRCKENLPEMLEQMLEFLKSRNSFSREAAAILIGCCAEYMTRDVVTSKQIEEVFLGLRDLQEDREASVAQAAAESMEVIFRQCGHRINPDLISSQLLSKVIRSISVTKLS
ncbi:maestro heat-like repeat family member 5 [Thamnophis elegans]|uniref:maestro heat-like repeat family member 5 n=1 Tax=Thamnophis elegans TaxID=35005 RepID=UPI001376B04A|nr:maestro heat-like repeat family member 5 [Thamnophis elegans]